MKKMISIILALIMVFALSATAFADDYIVQKGDSLWKIAQKTLGSGAKWSAIYEANKDNIKNPSLIYPGQVFHLPDGASAQTGVMPALPESASGGLPALGGGLPPLPDGVSSAVAAMVSFYAPIEFYTMDEEFIALGDSKSANHSKNSFETDYLGIPDMTVDKEGVYKSWWGTYKDSLPETLPVWIQAGTADTNVPCTQSQNLASGLTDAFGADNVHFGLIEGAAHEDDAFYTDENLAAIFSFLADALK